MVKRTSDERRLMKSYIEKHIETLGGKKVPGDFIDSYRQLMEERIRILETEKQLLEVQRNKLEEDRDSLRLELHKLKQPPLNVGILLAILANGKALVKSSSGAEYTVAVDSSIPQNQRLPGSIVFLHQSTFAILEIIPEIQSPPPIGLHEQLLEAKEAIEAFLNI